MRRLLHFDEAPPLETPIILLATLREIDATVELVHFGTASKGSLPDNLRGKDLQDWRLGSVRPNEVRRKKGEAILEMESHRAIANMKNVLLGKIAVQGFAQIARYFSEGTPGMAVTYDEDGAPVNVVEDLRARDFEWRRNQGEDVFQRRADESEGIPQKLAGDALLLDKLHTDGRAEYRRAKRGAIITNLWGGNP